MVAFGSGATMAGLVAQLGAAHVIGVETGAVADSLATLEGLLDGMPGVQVRRGDLQLDSGQIGAGYAGLPSDARQAMRLAAHPPDHRTVFIHTGGLPGLFGHPLLPHLTQR